MPTLEAHHKRLDWVAFVHMRVLKIVSSETKREIVISKHHLEVLKQGGSQGEKQGGSRAFFDQLLENSKEGGEMGGNMDVETKSVRQLAQMANVARRTLRDLRQSQKGGQRKQQSGQKAGNHSRRQSGRPADGQKADRQQEKERLSRLTQEEVQKMVQTAL
mmetsp:Transcript_31519/g.62319  ORF Transcript_31519/g.62319 Transcript_31519/m.62319 type:complete len:161 (-) Transcript_31519:1054-1536(-)